MSVAEFSDAALVLLGHGSTLNAASADAVWHHADAFRRRRLFAEVREAFILLEPSVRGVLRGVFSPRVFLVPLFVSEGWFTREVIPLQLGLRGPGAIDFSRVQRHGTQTWHYGRAVGTHDSMTDVLLARARGIVARHPFPRCPRESDTALFIAGHGTAYSRGSRDAIEHQVECLRRRGAFAEVHAIFLEEDPRIDRCWEMSEARNLVVVPFFISDGLHTREDIPILLGEPEARVRERLAAGRPPWRNPAERQGRRLWYSEPVGLEPALQDVILEIVRETAAMEPGGT